MDEKKTITHRQLLTLLAVAALAGIVFLFWELTSAPSGQLPTQIVKPANPDDARYKPDPHLKLNASGSGA